MPITKEKMLRTAMKSFAPGSPALRSDLVHVVLPVHVEEVPTRTDERRTPTTGALAPTHSMPCSR